MSASSGSASPESPGRSSDRPGAGRHPGVLIFDGGCGFCSRSARWLADTAAGTVSAVPAQSLDSEAIAALGIREEDLRRFAFWVDDAGRVSAGHEAVGAALKARGGIARLAGMLVLAPVTSTLAKVLYRIVARVRHRLPGSDGSCRLLRETDSGA